jgi:hypothetical protein
MTEGAARSRVRGVLHAQISFSRVSLSLTTIERARCRTYRRRTLLAQIAPGPKGKGFVNLPTPLSGGTEVPSDPNCGTTRYGRDAVGSCSQRN